MTEPFDLPGGEEEFWKDYEPLDYNPSKPVSLVKLETPYERFERKSKPSPDKPVPDEKSHKEKNYSPLMLFFVFSLAAFLLIAASVIIYILGGLLSGRLMIVW